MMEGLREAIAYITVWNQRYWKLQEIHTVIRN